MRLVNKILKYEFHNTIRSKWVILYTLFFFLVGLEIKPNQSFPVRVKLQRGSVELFPGMFAKAEIAVFKKLEGTKK